VLEKAETYWQKEKVHIDRIEFLPIADSSVRLTNLRSGELDIIERLSPSDVEQVKGARGIHFASAPGLGYGFLMFNIGNGPRGKVFADPRLREAVELSIDREILVRTVFGEHYSPGNGWFPPGSPYYNSAPLPKRDVPRARQILKDAGQPDIKFTVIVAPDRDRRVAAQVIQAMLAEAGITMEIEPQENVTSLQSAVSGNFEALLTFWSGRIDPDGNSYDFAVCNRVMNWSKYCNPAVDERLAAARRVPDMQARKRLYDEAGEVYWKDRPLLSLWHQRVLFGVSDKVKGFVPYPDGTVRPVNIRIER
jgi:peptide/nickel transport system substrate-binding protein